MYPGPEARKPDIYSPATRTGDTAHTVKMVLATRGRKSRIRRLADYRSYDTGILLVIMFNCVIMAFPPNKLKNATSPTDFFCLADFILNFIFFCGKVRD